MPPSGVDYASEFLNGYAPEYVLFGNNWYHFDGLFRFHSIHAHFIQH